MSLALIRAARFTPHIAPLMRATRSTLAAHRDPILQRLRFSRRDLHQAGLVGKLAVESSRAGEPAPRLNAQEQRAWLRPDAELPKTRPGDLERWTAWPGIAHRAACRRIEDHGIRLEQPLRKLQHCALHRRWLRLGAHQPARQPPDRRGLWLLED